MAGVGAGHRLAAVALLGAVLVGLYWLADRVVIAQYQFYQANIEQLQDRLHRLNRMLATREDLHAKLRQIRQDQSVDAFFLQQPSPTLAATELQQRVKEVAEAHGGKLSSTQILPVSTEEGFTRVAIHVMMNADTEAVQKVLYNLESNTPLLFIDNLRITARKIRRRVDRNQRRAMEVEVQLTIQFELAGYMRGGAA